MSSNKNESRIGLSDQIKINALRKNIKKLNSDEVIERIMAIKGEDARASILQSNDLLPYITSDGRTKIIQSISDVSLRVKTVLDVQQCTDRGSIISSINDDSLKKDIITDAQKNERFSDMELAEIINSINDDRLRISSLLGNTRALSSLSSSDLISSISRIEDQGYRNNSLINMINLRDCFSDLERGELIDELLSYIADEKIEVGTLVDLGIFASFNMQQLAEMYNQFDDDSLKSRYISNSSVLDKLSNHNVVALLNSIEDSKIKLETLSNPRILGKITNYDVFKVLDSVSDENLRVSTLLNPSVFDKINSHDSIDYIYNFIQSVTDDKCKMKLFENPNTHKLLFDDELALCKFIESIDDNQMKLDILLSDDVLNRLSPEVITDRLKNERVYYFYDSFLPNVYSIAKSIDDDDVKYRALFNIVNNNNMSDVQKQYFFHCFYNNIRDQQKKANAILDDQIFDFVTLERNNVQFVDLYRLFYTLNDDSIKYNTLINPKIVDYYRDNSSIEAYSYLIVGLSDEFKIKALFSLELEDYFNDISYYNVLSKIDDDELKISTMLNPEIQEKLNKNKRLGHFLGLTVSSIKDDKLKEDTLLDPSLIGKLETEGISNIFESLQEEERLNLLLKHPYIFDGRNDVARVNQESNAKDANMHLFYSGSDRCVKFIISECDEDGIYVCTNNTRDNSLTQFHIDTKSKEFNDFCNLYGLSKDDLEDKSVMEIWNTFVYYYDKLNSKKIDISQVNKDSYPIMINNILADGLKKTYESDKIELSSEYQDGVEVSEFNPKKENVDSNKAVESFGDMPNADVKLSDLIKSFKELRELGVDLSQEQIDLIDRYDGRDISELMTVQQLKKMSEYRSRQEDRERHLQQVRNEVCEKTERIHQMNIKEETERSREKETLKAIRENFENLRKISPSLLSESQKEFIEQQVLVDLASEEEHLVDTGMSDEMRDFYKMKYSEDEVPKKR